MKTMIASVPPLRIHKKTGHARVRLDGREYWCGRAGTPEAEARYRALVARWAARQTVDEPPPPPTPRGHITVAEALAGYLAEVRGNSTPAELRRRSSWGTASSMATSLERLAGVRLADVGPKMFQDWVARLAREPMAAKRGGATVTRTSTQVKRLAAEFRRLVRWAVAGELVGPERLVALQAVTKLPLAGARPAGKRKPVPAADLAAVLDRLPPVLQAVVTVLACSGARPSEVLEMRPVELDRSGDVWILRPGHHKTEQHGVVRSVVLGPRCQEALGPWLTGVPDTDIVFTTDDLRRAAVPGTVRLRRRRSRAPITPADLRRAVRLACDAAAVPAWTPYQLRHLGLTEFRKAGGLDAAQVQGGHTSSRTTERYAEPDLRCAIEAARVCG